MLLPTTHSAVLLLLALALVCLGSWASVFKLAGPGKRFELFYIDFAFGAVASAAILAWTAGTLGSQLSFLDRIAVAGLREQALALAGGFLFSLGNMLLLAGVSLLGMATAFPLACAVALVVWSLMSLHGVSYALLTLGDVLLLAAVFTALASRAAAEKEKAPPPAKASRRRRKVTLPPLQRRAKGALAAIFGGFFIGTSYPLAEDAFWGDLGLLPYAGLLLYALGLLISTLVFSVFFLNIAIDGRRLSPRAYFRGGFQTHLLGLAAGPVWAGGLLAWLLAQSAPAAEQAAYPLLLWALEGSAVVAVLWGYVAWREFQGRTSKATAMIGVTVLLYVAGLAALGLRFKS